MSAPQEVPTPAVPDDRHPVRGEPETDPATERELRRMALIHRRSVLASRRAVPTPITRR